MNFDKTTLDFLEILIPVITTVITTIVGPVVVKLINNFRQSPKPNHESTTHPPYPAAPHSNPTALGRVGRFLRSSLFVSGVAGLTIGLSIVFFPSFTKADLPAFDVQQLHIRFSQPSDEPSFETRIAVPPVAHTRGTTQHIADKDRSMWVIVCNRVVGDEATCTIQRLNLDISGTWDDFVNIGEAEQECAIFTVGFVAVDKQTDQALEISSSHLLHSKLPDKQFLVKKWFVTRRELNEFEDPILCSAQSSTDT